MFECPGSPWLQPEGYNIIVPVGGRPRRRGGSRAALASLAAAGRIGAAGRTGVGRRPVAEKIPAPFDGYRDIVRGEWIDANGHLSSVPASRELSAEGE
jgi:hypothetical protein